MAPVREDTIRAHWKSLAACVLLSMCPFQYGLDFGVIGSLQAMKGFLMVFGNPDPASPIGYNISSGRQQLISSLMVLGAFITSALVGPIAQVLGRKGAVWAACLGCIISNVIMMTVSTIGGLYAARLLIGFANGMFMTFSQLYIQECAPPKYRGMMIGCFGTFTSLGSLIGVIIDNGTNHMLGKESYIIPLGMVYILPGLLAIGLLFVPESPRWLLQMGKDEQALKSLKWLRPFPELIEPEYEEMKTAINAEEIIAKHSKIVDLWRDPIDRRRTLLAIGGVTLQAASGAMYMISYGTYFFEMANVGSPFENSCILTAVGVVAIIINSSIITKIGRRRVFLFWGMVACGIAQLLVAVVYTVHPGTASTGKAIVGLSIIYIVAYNGSVSTYAWLCAGEFPSQRLRSYTFGLAAAVGFLGAWLATFTAPYFINIAELNWGPKYGYIWTPSCLLGAAWVWFFLPEVKDRTFEEIDEMFMAKLPARKFRGYKCVGAAALVVDEKEAAGVTVSEVETRSDH